MEKSISAQTLEVNSVGNAIECGTLAVLTDSMLQQPVLVMPLERTIQRGSLTVHQWAIHITARNSTKIPISYATFRAAEVVQRPTGLTFTLPVLQRYEGEVVKRAQQFQQQLQTCIIELLTHDPHVSQIVVPARFRLLDEWVWSARCQEQRIQYRNEAWVLMEI